MDFSNMEVTIDHIADAGAKIKAYATVTFDGMFKVHGVRLAEDVYKRQRFLLSGHLLSHSNSFGFEMEKDTAGCRAYHLNYIVGGFVMKKAIVITLGVIIGVTGVLAICAHLADAAKLALYAPEDEDDEDIY